MSQTVDRALTVLASLAEGPASLEDAARRIGVHKSTALRLLRTLEEHGLVHRQPDYRYRLGGRLFALAQAALENLDVRQVAAPHLAALNERCGHAVHLAAFDADSGEIRYVDKLEGHYPERLPTRIGRPAPPTATAVGKVLMADRTAELTGPARRLLAERLEYPAYTARSVRTADEYLAELDRVRARGWAADRAEHEEAVHCVAAPILGTDGRAIAACSVSAPAVAASMDELREQVPELLRTTAAVSAEYGADG
ncbi:IclR family transcriptional regulator [Phaeacidiphilus oryzae]|uniref:IclR family transcriptional regulator n=1 Tax=Phaeacidiphilus oryzae TaxID=348818 RepID=UPI000562C641|nr:IclR family transcriptional regulator [Phaeacidiphilus oryzae]